MKRFFSFFICFFLKKIRNILIFRKNDVILHYVKSVTEIP